MPKLGTAHPDNPEFKLVSLSGGELIFKGPKGRVFTEAEVAQRAEAPQVELVVDLDHDGEEE